MSDDLVYRPWPRDVIWDAVDQLRRRIHGGADSDELRVGLVALDFLTRASDMDETTAVLVESLRMEATMRAELMDARDAALLSNEERRTRLRLTVRHASYSLDRVCRLIESIRAEDADELRARVDRYLEARRRAYLA